LCEKIHSWENSGRIRESVEDEGLEVHSGYTLEDGLVKLAGGLIIQDVLYSEVRQAF
jgi:hypothetical protein